jgi:hypothetical protein
MRVIACILATFAVTASALADGWKEYADPTYAFAVSFPGDPRSRQRPTRPRTTKWSRRVSIR